MPRLQLAKNGNPGQGRKSLRGVYVCFYKVLICGVLSKVYLSKQATSTSIYPQGVVANAVL